MRLPLHFGSFNELGATLRLAEIGHLARTGNGQVDPDRPLLWVEGRDLIGKEAVWLPYEIVHADATILGPQSSGWFAASTNGLASGNHFLEATSHGVCEVMERDATSLWHRLSPTALDGTRVDLATVQDDSCRNLLDRLLRADLDIAVWETTTDVGITAFQCLVVDRTGEIRHTGHGAGCHPTREIALMRAITEALQVRTTYIVGSREDIGHVDYGRATLDARLRRAQALMRPVARMRDFNAIDQLAFDSFEAEVAWLVSRLQAVRIHQVIVVDLTRSEFAVPVVRVVIPGLEGSDHHAGYVPGVRARAMEARQR
jgi:ribosomal protein S12 methylthiotransferase accessory factor